MTISLQVWVLLFICFLILEVATVSLVSIWFCLGALVAGIICYFGGSIPLQIAGFILSSGVGMGILFPIKKRFLRPRETNAMSLIGAEGIVTKPIEALGFDGQIKVKNQQWSAIADEDIEIGAHVIVEKIEGAHLVVKKKYS